MIFESFKNEYGEFFEVPLRKMINSIKFFRNRVKRVEHFARMFGMTGRIDQEVCELEDINCYLSAVFQIKKKILATTHKSLLKDYSTEIDIPV